MELFRLAHIEFGRVDYSFKDGKIQVWEINTCPLFSTGKPDWYAEERRGLHQYCADTLAEAFDAISLPANEARVPIKLSWPPLG
jgi:hypothetical protein